MKKVIIGSMLAVATTVVAIALFQKKKERADHSQHEVEEVKTPQNELVELMLANPELTKRAFENLDRGLTELFLRLGPPPENLTTKDDNNK